MNGIILVDKPSGITSFGVVARMRKILNMKKLREKESSAKFLDDLERLPELSKEELTALSERVKNFNKKKK